MRAANLEALSRIHALTKNFFYRETRETREQDENSLGHGSVSRISGISRLIRFAMLPVHLSRNDAVKELDFDRIYKIYRMENGMRLEIMAHRSVFAFASANLSCTSCKSCQNPPFQLHGSGLDPRRRSALPKSFARACCQSWGAESNPRLN